MNLRLWSRQIDAIVRLELKKYVFGRRWLGVYLLGLAPVFLFAMRALISTQRWIQLRDSMDILDVIYASFFQLYLLRFGIFFGCLHIFTQLFRGEILEKTLHYYLLVPVRREVLAIGKYLAGLVTATAVFAGATIATYVLMFVPAGAEAVNRFFFEGPGLQHLGRYVAVAMLACLGYGALFLLLSVFFRNPKAPALLFLGWESMNFVLPAFLQKFSVVHYLQSICPVTIPRGPLAVITAPTSAWYSVPGLLILTLAILAVASVRIRRVQITYSAD